MEVDVVHTAGEHEVEIGLHLRQRRTEVLGEPCKRLARCERLAHDVSGRRGVFQHRHIAIILSGFAWIGTQPFDAEL